MYKIEIIIYHFLIQKKKKVKNRLILTQVHLLGFAPSETQEFEVSKI